MYGFNATTKGISLPFNRLSGFGCMKVHRCSQTQPTPIKIPKHQLNFKTNTFFGLNISFHRGLRFHFIIQICMHGFRGSCLRRGRDELVVCIYWVRLRLLNMHPYVLYLLGRGHGYLCVCLSPLYSSIHAGSIFSPQSSLPPTPLPLYGWRVSYRYYSCAARLR